MKWNLSSPLYGDMIRVKLGNIYHYGIYVSDDEVIQFGLAPSQRSMLKDSEIKVLSSDIDSFLAGGFLEVAEFDKKERKKNRAPEDVVGYARARIGDGGYNILYNNCEHFANECISGEHKCAQADAVRAMFRSMPVVDVYIAKIPNGEIRTVSNKERNNEIKSVSCESVKKEKYYVWRLLEYALERSLGLNIKKIDISKDEYGRWVSSACDFSLSHSKDYVAVAISRSWVGIDIECIHKPKSEKFADRILTDSELAEYASVAESEKAEYLISKWTEKEALFKSYHKKSFVPREYEPCKDNIRNGRICCNGEEYIWSVATETPERLRVYANVELEKYE